MAVKGVLYYSTNADQVRAVDEATGPLLWQYTLIVNFYLAITGGGASVPTSRGVTVADGRLYLLTFDDQLTRRGVGRPYHTESGRFCLVPISRPPSNRPR